MPVPWKKLRELSLSAKDWLWIDWAKTAASRLTMKIALCVCLPLQAERNLLSSRRWQSGLAVTHFAGWKKVIIRTVIFPLFSHSSHSMAVCCLSAHRCWYLMHTDVCAHNTPQTCMQESLQLVVSTSALGWTKLSQLICTGKIQLLLMSIFWGCLLQCGPRMSKYSASCSSFGIFIFLHFLGFFKWLMNSIESIYTYRWALAYKSLLCTHASH